MIIKRFRVQKLKKFTYQALLEKVLSQEPFP